MITLIAQLSVPIASIKMLILEVSRIKTALREM